MKIVMVGPVFPYKGGISHYTGMMSRNLMKEHQVINVSFSLQYPKVLYKRPQKDFDNDAFKVDGTHFIVNTVNPFSWAKTARFIKNQNPDMVIFQWWHPFFAPSYWAILKLIGRKTKVVFMCHNVLPHEGFPAKRLLSKMVLNRGDHFILHTQMDAADLTSLVKEPVYSQTVHPTYNAFKIKNLAKGQARELLGLRPSDEVLLFFGYIREYKGLKHLIRAMPRICRHRPNLKLLVVGDFFEGNKGEYVSLIENCGCQGNIILVDGYTPDKEVEKYFAACDLVVLPYESATQSGIVQIAYGFDKPVVVTDVGGLPEVVADDKTGFVVPPKNPEQLAKAVVRFFEETDAEAFAENVRAEAYKYDWDRMNEVVDSLSAFRSQSHQAP